MYFPLITKPLCKEIFYNGFTGCLVDLRVRDLIPLALEQRGLEVLYLPGQDLVVHPERVLLLGLVLISDEVINSVLGDCTWRFTVLLNLTFLTLEKIN